jgi:transketolase
MYKQPTGSIEQIAINTIRTLSADAVQKANSGHPGTPMALAPAAYYLWQNLLNYDPNNPIWPNRDRFVLSNGHASMLLYSLLHLSQVKAVTEKYEVLSQLAVPLDDIKRFRQLDSLCPGHPEYRWTSGVETTTGPLGQGVANSVGMAIASRWLGDFFNRPGFELFNYRVYAFCGDGCLMEGVSSEAASMAGHLQLSNLCWVYDNNHITIEGSTNITFTENVAERFHAYGWHVLHVTDVNDLKMLQQAYMATLKEAQRPTLIILDTHIGYGAPDKQDTAAAHGEALGEDEIRLAKRFYGWPEDEHFLVPDAVIEHFKKGLGTRGESLHQQWKTLFEAYEKKYPEQAKMIHQMQQREIPDNYDQNLPTFPADAKGIASRDASHLVQNAMAKQIPWLNGGSADLSPSTKTLLNFAGAGDLTPSAPLGRNMHFGLREHGMAAICNGLALSKIRPFASTFLTFSDYAKPSIRLSALMEIPVIYIFTHDSIDLGEDGPTHQPVEQILSLRAIPNFVLIRPADANEVAEAWRTLLTFKRHPCALILTRQALPTIDRSQYACASGVAQGAYVLADCKGTKPQVILLASGSEVILCLKAYEQLKNEGVAARVVSMPSLELFENQSQTYKDSVLPPELKARVSVEAASVIGWERYVGSEGSSIGMHTFGRSAPIKDVQKLFGFEPEHIIAEAKAQIKKHN